MNQNIYYLIKIIQNEPKLFEDEIIKYTDDNILVFMTFLFSNDRELFNLLITYLGENIEKNNTLRMLLRIFRNNNMEVFKYILLVNIPYILSYYINKKSNNIEFLLNNLILYDILLVNAIKFVKYENNLENLYKLLNSHEELKDYIFIINKILNKYKLEFKIDNILNNEIFFYENVKKNKVLKLDEFSSIFRKKNTIFVNGNNFLILNKEGCHNKYKNIFLLDDIINNTILGNKKVIDLYDLLIILDIDDYKLMFPVYIDNKINLMKYNNIYFMALNKNDIDNFLKETEEKFCRNQDIILNNKKDIDNYYNGDLNIIKIEKIDDLLGYFRNFKNKI